MAAGDIVYYQGRPLYVLAETDGGTVVSPLNAPVTFHSGDEYEGYPFVVGNLTDADGNQIDSTPDTPTVTPAKKVQPKSGKD